MLTKSKQIALTSLLFALSNVAFAAGEGFYFGLGVGESNIHQKTQTFTTNTVPPSTITVKPSNTGVGERLFLGYNLNPYAAIESGLITHYAAATYNVPASAMISCNNPAVRENSFDLEGKGMYPFGNTGFDVFFKAGFAYMYASSSGSLVPSQTTSVCGSSSTTVTKTVRPLGAIGVSYDLTPAWVLDLTYQHVSGGGGIQEATFTSLGISYHIVDHFCGQFLC